VILGTDHDRSLEKALSLPEQALYETFRSERRRHDWLAGRVAAKKLIIEHHRAQGDGDLKPAEIEITYGPHGSPQALIRGEPLEEMALSIAHSCGHGLAGLSQLNYEGRIGVDIERIRPLHPRLAARFLSPEELGELQARFSSTEGIILYWTLKEAALKALWPITTPRPSMRQLRVRLAEQEDRAYITLSPPSLLLEARYWREEEFSLALALAPIGAIL